MKQWSVLLKKEILEMARNFKWIWVPLTFIIIGINQPISSYYLPEIIDSLGGLPEGTVIKIPDPSAEEVLIKGLSQYTTIGVLIIILITMGILAGERKSGVAAMILVKPVSYASFVTAKWTGGLLLIFLSFFAGFTATWYYTGVLYDWVDVGLSFQTFLFYLLWLIFVITVTLFFSSALLSAGMAGFLAIAVTMIVSLISSSFSYWLKWSPSRLTAEANNLLLTGEFSKSALAAGLLTGGMIILLLFASIFVFRKKELAA